MEHKQTEALILSTDEAQGIVEAVWAVMGNVDEGDDVIHPGSFTKTFRERKDQVNLLDNHRTDSVMSALGTVLDLRELNRSELPSELLQQYPEATGGAWGQFQFLLDTLEGKGAFTRIKNRAVKKWSFGYDSIIKDFGKALKNGKERTVRNLRELKLYEISPVLFAMNEATTTTGVKAASEAKPYRAVRDGDKWEVYKLDSDGKPTGSSLGSHDSQEEANQQIAALYANEKGQKELVNGKPVRRLGDVLQGTIHKIFTSMVDEWYIQGYMDREQRIAISSLIGESLDILANGIPAEIAQYAPNHNSYYYDCMSKIMISEMKAGRVLSARNAQRIKEAMDSLHQCLMEAGLMEEEDEKGGATGPQQSNDSPTSNEAGPNKDDSTRLLIQIKQEELKLLEVQNWTR